MREEIFSVTKRAVASTVNLADAVLPKMMAYKPVKVREPVTWAVWHKDLTGRIDGCQERLAYVGAYLVTLWSNGWP